MPAAAPRPQTGGQELLQVIGCRIKERRRELGLTAVATAGAEQESIRVIDTKKTGHLPERCLFDGVLSALGVGTSS